MLINHSNFSCDFLCKRGILCYLCINKTIVSPPPILCKLVIFNQLTGLMQMEDIFASAVFIGVQLFVGVLELILLMI